MKWTHQITVITLAAAALGIAFACRSAHAGSAPPSGWVVAGSAPSDYEMTPDTTIKHGGRSSGHVRSATPKPSGFGTLMQTFDAGEYRGKRVRLAAYVRSADVREWAGVWMRVDGPESHPSLAFDNMQRRPIRGTSDWSRYEVVLDVAPEATNIALGVLLTGAGEVWLDDVLLEVVPTTVPTTDVLGNPGSAARPRNLGLEE